MGEEKLISLEEIKVNTEINVKLISMDDIVNAGCFDIDSVIEIIEKVLIEYKQGRVLLPDKISQIFDEKVQNRINCMPATLLNEKICGVKWVSVFPNNPHTFLIPNVSGTIILSEIEKGFPFAVMDGTFITALRTACMGGIGAKYLAKKDSHIYGTIGTGEQAQAHFMIMKHIFPKIDICYVASRTVQSEMMFIKRMKEKYADVNFISCNSNYEMATQDADIIVTAVSCQQPLLKAKAIKKGAYYCHVGGWEDEYEVPLKASKIVCDNWDALKHRGSPTIARMYEKGLLADNDIYADIADLIDGSKMGRDSDSEFNYFNAIGLAFVDISVAYSFYKKVIKKGFGKEWTVQTTDAISAFNKNN